MTRVSARVGARQQGYPAFPDRPFQSGQFLLRALEASFGDDAGFRIECAEVVARADLGPAASSDEGRYRSLWLGHERACQEFPEGLWTDSSRTLVARGELGLKLGPNQTLLEAARSTEAPHSLD